MVFQKNSAGASPAVLLLFPEQAISEVLPTPQMTVGSDFISIVYLGRNENCQESKDSRALTQMRIQSVRILRTWIGLGSRSSL